MISLYKGAPVVILTKRGGSIRAGNWNPLYLANQAELSKLMVILECPTKVPGRLQVVLDRLWTVWGSKTSKNMFFSEIRAGSTGESLRTPGSGPDLRPNSQKILKKVRKNEKTRFSKIVRKSLLGVPCTLWRFSNTPKHVFHSVSTTLNLPDPVSPSRLRGKLWKTVKNVKNHINEMFQTCSRLVPAPRSGGEGHLKIARFVAPEADEQFVCSC